MGHPASLSPCPTRHVHCLPPPSSAFASETSATWHDFFFATNASPAQTSRPLLVSLLPGSPPHAPSPTDCPLVSSDHHLHLHLRSLGKARSRSLGLSGTMAWQEQGSHCPWFPHQTFRPPHPCFASFYGPKRKESQKRFLSPTPCPAFQNSSSHVQGASGFSCSLSCLHKGTERLLPGCGPPTHPYPAEGGWLLQHQPGPLAQHLVATCTLLSTLVLWCGEPRILGKLGQASHYPNEPPDSASGDPLLSPEIRLCPFHCTNGFASPFPPWWHLQLGPQSCCSHSLFPGSLTPGPDLSHVLSADCDWQFRHE